MAIAGSRDRLNVLRCVATGAALTGTLFALCWLGVALGLTGGSHMFVALFTVAPMASWAALCAGLAWSLIFGALSGALLAIFYNLFRPRVEA